MMRFLKTATVVVFILSLVAFAGYKYYSTRVADRTPPVIHAETEVLDAKMGASDEELLKGITATDDRDGDLSGHVLVQGVSQLVTDDTALVTYVVFDSSNNMGSLKRTVHYTNYAKPHFAIKQPLFYAPNTLITITDRITASDISGKDFSEGVHVVAQNVQKNVEGLYSITVQVSNDMGDYESLQLPLVISQKYCSVQPVVLTSYLEYLKVGDSFKPESYIKTVGGPGAGTLNFSKVVIESDVDTTKAGTYQVAYSYEDCAVYLTVVVK